MTALIVSLNDDGTVTVAPCDPSPDMLAKGEQFGSVDEAVKALGEILANPDSGSPGQNSADSQTADSAPAPDAMGMGYQSARRGH